MTDARTALAGRIDHTLLKPQASRAQVAAYCDEARRHGFAAVCVNPCHVTEVATHLADSPVATCSVVGFPLGANTSDIKAAEARAAVADGADEIDMVLAVGALVEGDDAYVAADIAAVRQACATATLKIIIEACLLDHAAKRAACRIAREAGADFVKTSTGFAEGGATVADIALMHAEVGGVLGIKASGGIRTREAAEALIAAGATRIGASNGIALLGD
ncbi:deoxyribose-phosphate aldolase [uncultured Salinisphaera sp.]|uniref:deoxyribose-phosphate aldolase n=1 Tax=uncultured Salinisphaera sp. TaxID=359372 RepID=UPI0032B2A422|tara:strand:+ start:20730 stop:21386 length:657 start_codon:yes stop_codon:yes gene_type:complete